MATGGGLDVKCLSSAGSWLSTAADYKNTTLHTLIYIDAQSAPSQSLEFVGD